MLIDESAGAATDPEVDDEDGDDAPEGDESAETKSTDPLDLIEDEEERAEAKRLRAIARRNKHKAAKEPEPVATSNFATKDDLKKMATNEAKKLVAPEVKALWDELVAVPLGGFDPMDPESIAANMDKRYKLYQIDNPQNDNDPAKVFTASPTIPHSGGAKAAPKTESRPLPGYKEPVQPSSWYA